MEQNMSDEKKTNSDAPKKRGRPKAPPKPKKERAAPAPPNSYARKRAVEYAEASRSASMRKIRRLSSMR